MAASPVDAMQLSPLPILLALAASTPLRAQVDAAVDPLAPAPSSAVPLEEIRRFAEVFRTVQEGYVDPIAA